MATQRKVAFITGAGGAGLREPGTEESPRHGWGLGRSVALQMARKGYDIAAADIREDWGMETVKMVEDSTGQKAVFIKMDLSKPASIKAGVDRAVSEFGRIDALANIGALDENKRIGDITEEHFDKLINVNLKGTIFTCQAVFPIMRRQGGGRIVNISSGGAVQPLKGLSVYSATKAGVIIFTKILAWELARDNIVAVCVAPGMMIRSELPEDERRENRHAPFLRGPTTDEVGNVIVYALTAEGPALTGQTLHPNAGGYMV